MPPTPQDHGRVSPAVHAATLFASNAVPLVGWFFQHWSASTTLVVYWSETFAALLFIYLRGILHQRWNPRRGHFRYAAPAGRGAQRSFIKGFALTAFVFTAAHGFFIAMIVLILSHNGFADLVGLNWRTAGIGSLQVFALAAADFLADLPYLRSWSFAQLEQTANRSFGRIALMHFTLIFGMFGAAVTDSPAGFFSVFVGLKTLYAISSAVPQWEPKTPPAWLSGAMNRIRREPKGQRFEDMWVKDQESEVARRKRNEQAWTGAD